MISLEYYLKIFDGNASKMAQIKGLIVIDFKNIEKNFFEADKVKDLAAMKVQLHRMYPIVSNLRYKELLRLISHYQSHQEYTVQFEDYATELKNCLSTLYQFLESE
jgi:hypothetical protein